VLDKAVEVFENRSKKIPTSTLNEVMLEAVEKHHPPSTKGKFVKIKYVTQLPTPTPTFAFFAGNAKYIRQPYKQYLENRLREAFNFEGVPLILVFREK
jgi:GTP-binding protein